MKTSKTRGVQQQRILRDAAVKYYIHPYSKFLVLGPTKGSETEDNKTFAEKSGN